MSSRIDPSEIDDEAHNMDIMWEYPAEFCTKPPARWPTPAKWRTS